ncbi:MAG: type III polyketide synthase [Acidobacteriota bacterium]
MPIRLLAAAAMPTRFSVSQTDSAEFASTLCCDTPEQQRLLSALYRRTRIRKRGSALLDESNGRIVHTFFERREGPGDSGPTTSARMVKFEQHAGALACRACEEALSRAGLSASAVTHLIVVTCTGFYAPGIDYDVMVGLGLRSDLQRIQIGFMGCHAVLNALGVAQALVASDPDARVLIVSVELCSLHFQYGWDADHVVSNSLFADGAGALVIGGGEPESGGTQHWTCIAHGSDLVPDSADAMTWRIGDAGFQMTLSARVPELIERNLAHSLERWLRKYDCSLSQIRSWAVHPGGPRILTATEKALGLPPEALQISRSVLSGNGNMSSATMTFLLDEMIRRDSARPCLALGFGPGLTIESALFG